MNGPLALMTRCHARAPALAMVTAATLVAAQPAAAQGVAPAPAAAPEPAPMLAPPAQASAPTPVVDVRQYLVLGVTLLDPRAIETALGKMTGPRTVEELHRAAATVQGLYARAGYGAVVAFLPPQEISGGVVTLQVIEGRLAAVRVEGAGPAFDSAGILASLSALRTGETPRLDRLDAQLRMANDNPAKRTRLVLLPGRQPELTEAEIGVQAGPQRQLSLELDNTGAPATGRARVALGWLDANLGGRDDVLDLRLQVSPAHPDRFAAASLSYRLPLYAAATMLEGFALVSNSRSDRIPTAAGDLRFAGRGNLVGLRATHYLRRLEALDPRLALGLERRDQRNQCAIGDLPEDACGSAGADLVITPLSLGFSVAGDAELPLAASATLVQGLPLGGHNADRRAFEAVRPGARPGFTALRGQGQWQQPLGDRGWELHLRGALQLSVHPLVPAMQFGAGGRDSVRGYEERELAADHGVALSLELAAPRRLPTAPGGLTWRALAFADAAVLRNRDAVPCSGTRTRCDPASAGAGLRGEIGALTGGLDIARTLRDGGTTAHGRTRAHAWLRVVL